MGMSMSPRTLIAAIAVVASTALAPIAHADGKNEIRAVTFDESGGTTSVHVRGADAPTFTVYKLERPTRVVIDMPQARLADAVRGHESAATFSPNTWAVSTIAAQQLDDNGVRVVVTMARPGRYDVKTVGSEVIVMVMPRDAAPKTTSPEDLVRAQQQASTAETARAAAQQQADAATATAKQMRSDAEAAKRAAAEQIAKAEAAQHAVAQASAADLGAAKQAAAQAKQAADQAKRDAETARATAASAQLEADRSRSAAEKAKQQALAEAQIAKADAAKAHDEARTAQAETEQARREARAQLALAKSEASRAQTVAEKKAAAAELALAQAKADAASERAAAELARRDTSTAQAEAARARGEALAAKSDAAADKKKAEAARADAEKMLRDAKSQVASLEKKTASAQQLEDKARAASAAAQAREEAARDSEARAQQERLAAETAVKQATDAQSRVVASERTKAAADAQAAESRLAMARRATEATEGQRRAAEQAAKAAKAELDQSRTMLAGVEQQRMAAMSAAAAATRARSEALAAADDASRRRTESEQAANEAAKKKQDAELAVSDAVKLRTEALQAAKSAQVARDAAESQRKVAERAAQTAMNTKSSAELSFNELAMKRQAAERAAGELEARSKAEAKAQAEMVTAQTRRASDKELADARLELAKLATERKQAEAELADRRKAVSTQQAEAARLETVASQAKDAAGREETRRQALAQKRTAEEAELASLTAAKLEAQKVKTQVRVAEADKPAVASVPASVPASAPASAPASVPAKDESKKAGPAKLTKVTAISFKGDDGNGQVSITVGDDAKLEVGEITATHAELIVDNAELAARLERTLDVSKFGSPVKSVSSFRDRKQPNRVRLVAELAQPATPTIDRDAKTIRWHFISGESIAQRPVRMVNVPSPVVGGFGAASTPVAQQSVTQVPPQGNRRRIYHGAPVDFDFKDAPIADLLRVISDTGHINIVVPQTIDAKVTVRLKHVPWDQALEVILQSYGLWYRREGIIYRIATQKELDAEDSAEAMRREAALKAEVPRTEVVTLNYASAEELKPKLENMKSAHGTIEVDPRTNALIVNDVAGNRAEIVKLALSLDTQTPQISIEARIVEARSTFLRQIGIQWGGNAITGANGGNATGLSFPSNIAVTGANSDAATIATGVAAPSDFAINLPASTGAGEGGALGFSLGSIGGNFNVNLRLSALEDSGTVRIISAPKVTVLNNRQAKISQGVSIPISVVSAAGTNTQFVQADLSLTVTPYVSQRDCAIAMDLLVQKNEPDFVNVGARGDPTILRKEARTYMLVADGETTVLGGIYTRNSGIAYKKIPLLGDIFVLGWLFKNRRENDDRTEILVFITPKITNKGSLPCTK